MTVYKIKKLCFYVYSYYEAIEVIKVFNQSGYTPNIAFKYSILKSLGVLWIIELSKSLEKKLDKKKFNIILNCQNNPALAVNCIRYGFSYIIFNGNVNYRKKIENIAKKNNVKINPKLVYRDLKSIKNYNIYINNLLK